MEWRILAPIVAVCAGCGVLSGLDGLHVIDGGADTSDPCEAGSCGAPQGFQSVLFAADRNTECPGSIAIDVVVDPSTQSASCVCTCDPTADGMCLPHALGYHTGDTCLTGATLPPLDGGCNAASGVPPSHVSIAPFAATCAQTANA